MLSEQDKKEMLQDAQSKRRRDAFRSARAKPGAISLDAYISFLNAVQKIFSPFRPLSRPTPTSLNKL